MRKISMSYIVLCVVTVLVGFPSWAVTFEHKTPHQMKMFDNAVDGFVERLKLIDSAQHHIYLEYFMYSTHQTTEIMTRKLVEKARQGVEVRLLVDAGPAMELNNFYTAYLKRHGIKVKYFNRGPKYNIFRLLHRDHRKILSVDGRTAMVGSRNVANEYFASDPEYDFLDRDVVVTGPVVKDIEANMTDYWNNSISVEAYNPPPRPSYFKKEQLAMSPKMADSYDDYVAHQKYLISKWDYWDNKAKNFIDTPKDFKELEKKYYQLAATIHHNVYTCPHVIYATNAAGLNRHSPELPTFLRSMVKQAKEEVILETPYFIAKRRERALFQELVDKKVEVMLLTNSLRSTDLWYVAAVFDHQIHLFTAGGAKAFIYLGNPLKDEVDMVDAESDKKVIWGIHAKSFVIDRRISIIGSYNLDPHSKNYNNELVLACLDNPQMAQDLSKSIHKRIHQAVKLDVGGKPVQGANKLWRNTPASKKKWYHLLLFPAQIFDFLL
ncbi:MAG: phosphatidylserine/phosphatidylglycerophosphate/cardiolipin synthase family protein [Pseudomonadota bacterium]